MNLKYVASMALDEAMNETDADESAFMEDPVVFAQAPAARQAKGRKRKIRAKSVFSDVRDALTGMTTLNFTVKIDTPKYGKTLGLDIPDDSSDVGLTGKAGVDETAQSVEADSNDEVIACVEDAGIEYAEGMQKFDVGGARMRCATPANRCRAKNPLTCRYHGIQVFKADIEGMIKAAFQRAGKQFNSELTVTMNHLEGGEGAAAGIVTLGVRVTVPEEDAELVRQGMRDFGNVPGVELVEGEDPGGQVDNLFDIDFDRLDPNQQARFRRDDLPEAAEAAAEENDNRVRQGVAAGNIVAEGDDPAEIQRQIDDVERRENEARGEVQKAAEAVKFLEDAEVKAPDALKGALRAEMDKQMEAYRQANERMKAAEAEGEGLQKKLEEANRLERERAANKAKIEEAQKVVDFAQQMVDNAPDALKVLAQQMLDKAKADLEQARGGANNVEAQAPAVENEPVGGENENGEIDDDDEDIEEDVPEPAGQVDDLDPEEDERQVAPVAVVNENPQVHEDGQVGPNEPAGDAQAVVTKDQAHQLLVAGKVAVSDANKAKDEVARLRDAGDEEGAKRLEEENIRKLNKGYALSHLTSREGLYKKDENGNLVTTGNDAASRMAAYYQRAYDRAVERHGAEGIANSKGVNGVKDAIAEMCNVLGCKAEFNGRDVKFTWGNGGGHEGPNGGGNGGGDNGGRQENAGAVNADAQAAHAEVNAAINAAVENNGERPAAQFNFAANGANVPENLKNLANVQANMAGMPHKFARLNQITPERLKAVIDHLPAGIANHHKDRTIDVLENGRRKRVPVADAIQQMIVNPNGDVGKAMQNRLNQWAAGHAKNSWVERLNQAMGLIHNGAGGDGNNVGLGADGQALNQNRPNNDEIELAAEHIQRQFPGRGDEARRILKQLIDGNDNNLPELRGLGINGDDAIQMIAQNLGEDNPISKYLKEKYGIKKEGHQDIQENDVKATVANIPQSQKGQRNPLTKEQRDAITIASRGWDVVAQDEANEPNPVKRKFVGTKHLLGSYIAPLVPSFIVEDARRRGFSVKDKPLDRYRLIQKDGNLEANCYKYFAASLLQNYGIECVPTSGRSDAEGESLMRALNDYYEQVGSNVLLNSNKMEELAKTEEEGTIIWGMFSHSNGVILSGGKWRTFDQMYGDHAKAWGRHPYYCTVDGKEVAPHGGTLTPSEAVAYFRECGVMDNNVVLIRPSRGICPKIWEMVERK